MRTMILMAICLPTLAWGLEPPKEIRLLDDPPAKAPEEKAPAKAPEEAPAKTLEAPGEEAPPPPPEEAPSAAPYAAEGLIGLSAGLKAGLDFSQPFNELGMSPAVELELGWRLPQLGSDLEIFLAAQWASPSGEGNLEVDERLPEPGTANYELTQDTLRLTLGALYRLRLDAPVYPFASLGFRTWMTSTEMSGDAGGESFGTYTEEGTVFGVSGALGAEWYVAGGAAVFELEGGWAPYDRQILSDTQVGTLAINLGWRHFF